MSIEKTDSKTQDAANEALEAASGEDAERVKPAPETKAAPASGPKAASATAAASGDSRRS